MSDNIIKLVVDNSEFKFWSSFEITQSMSTFDVFSFEAPFEQNSTIKDVIKPLQFKPGQLFIDDELLSTIVLVDPLPTIGNSKSITVSGYAKPGVLNDSSIPFSEYPIEFVDQTLEQIAKTLAGIYGVEVEFLCSGSCRSGEPFSKVKLKVGQPPYSFLIKLAKDRGFLISNTPDGKLLFWKAANNPDVTILKEGHTPLLDVVPNINPQGYYSEITGLGTVAYIKETETVTIDNPLLKVKRPFVYKTKNKLTGADLQKAVKWKTGLMIAESIKYSITVQGLRDERGNVWKPNTYINLTAPDAYVNNETTFLVDNLTLAKSDSDITTMNLVLPESRNGKIPVRLPWD
jgi:prophage tail gpP-like protein